MLTVEDNTWCQLFALKQFDPIWHMAQSCSSFPFSYFSSGKPSWIGRGSSLKYFKKLHRKRFNIIFWWSHQKHKANRKRKYGRTWQERALLIVLKALLKTFSNVAQRGQLRGWHAQDMHRISQDTVQYTAAKTFERKSLILALIKVSCHRKLRNRNISNK